MTTSFPFSVRLLALSVHRSGAKAHKQSLTISLAHHYDSIGKNHARFLFCGAACYWSALPLPFLLLRIDRASFSRI
jgi:hypothetical protein